MKRPLHLCPLLCLALTGAACADVIVDAGRVVRERPSGIDGTVIDAHTPRFATYADGIPFQADLRRASVKLGRNQTYPDHRRPGVGITERNVNSVRGRIARGLWNFAETTAGNTFPGPGNRPFLLVKGTRDASYA